jgi:aryl-alcohol dehydrogenase-like predicted oxidoreductase
VTNQEYSARYDEDWAFETAGKFSELAKAKGVHPVSLAVAWAAAHEDITCPIIGARHLEQLEPSLKSIEVEMTPELHAEISALSRMPAPATDRLEELLRPT